jgi:hypothetical protein
MVLREVSAREEVQMTLPSVCCHLLAVGVGLSFALPRFKPDPLFYEVMILC